MKPIEDSSDRTLVAPEHASADDAWHWLLTLRDTPVKAGKRTLWLGAQAEYTLSLSNQGKWHCNAPLSVASQDFLELYAPLCAPAGQSFAIAQMGQSLDGRIATHCGVSHYINGHDGLVHLHRLRALVDAVVVGSGTAAADNPRLSVRLVSGPDPVRVILDRHCRVPESHKVFSDGKASTLRLIDQDCPLPDGLADNVKCLSVPMDQDNQISVNNQQTSLGDTTVTTVLQTLAARGLNRVLIEGGGQTVSRFLDAGALDRLHVIVAPMIIGSGLPAFTLPEMDTLEHALRPASRRFDLGTDLLFDLMPKQNP